MSQSWDFQTYVGMGSASPGVSTAPALPTPEQPRGIPRTVHYRGVNRVYFNSHRDLPLFTFSIIEIMLRDPQVRLCLQMRAAPIQSVEFAYQDGVGPDGKPKWTPGVKSKDPVVAAWVLRQLQTIWNNYLAGILRSQTWGWAAGEVTLRLSEAGLLEIDQLLHRHAMDCRLLELQNAGTPWGVQFSNVPNHGKVELPFPYCYFVNFRPENGERYSAPVLLGAYSPWCDKWLNGGALDTRRLYMHKDAYGGMKVGYPEEEVYVDGNENPVSARDIALQIVEQRQAGGTLTYPTARDQNGNPKWIIEDATVASNPQHILQFPKDLDAEIRQGMEIPDGAISNDGAGSWEGKSLPLGAFYSGLDSWVVQILCDLRKTLEPLARMNFGDDVDFEICHKPLAQTAMEQQGQKRAGPDGGGEGFQGDPSGMMDDPSAAYRPQRMGTVFDPVEAVGQGVLSATAIVDAARRALDAKSPLRLSAVVVDADEDALQNPTEQVYKYACLMLHLPEDLSDRIREFQSNIADDQLAAGGREQESHVTLLYGFKDEELQNVLDALAEMQAPSATFFQLDAFPAGKDGAPLHVCVDSPDLQQLHSKLRSKIPAVCTHPEYKPHVTIAYMNDASSLVGANGPIFGESRVLDRAFIALQSGRKIEVSLGKASQVRMGWVPYEGERGGRGWKNSETGEVRYQDEEPSDSNSSGDTREEAIGSNEFRISEEAIASHPPVSVSMPSERFSGDVSKARAWAKVNLVGEYRNAQLQAPIRISNSSIQKLTSDSSTSKSSSHEHHLDALTALPSLIKNAVIFQSRSDRDGDPNVLRIMRMVAPMKIDGAVYAVKLTVKEYVSKEQGRKLYNQELQSIEMPDVIWVQESNQSPPNTPPSGTQVSLARIMAGVKFDLPKRMGSRPQLMGVDDVNSVSESDPAEGDDQAEAIAEILTSLYGDDAEDMFDKIYGVKRMGWSPIDHPRGPNGRFIAKNSPEAASAAKEKITEALNGPRSPSSLKTVTEHLSILTVKQLRELQKEHGIRAGGAKPQLVAKIADRLHGKVSQSDSQASKFRDDGTPKETGNRDIYTVPTSSLKVDPKRFQYKVKDIGEDGVTGELKGVSKWNPELAGSLLVWRDPADGQDYVINGHHRHELASRLKAEHVNARYIDAPNAKKARARGALANIAEGRGSAIDAAKYLRDSGQTLDHLREAGISMSGKLASDAVTLTDLNDKAFQKVAEGRLDETTALAVAKHLKDPALQDLLFKKLAALEDEGKDWSTREIETAARKMANAGKVTQTGFDLFGAFEDEKSTFDQEVELEAYANRMLKQEADDYRAVANKRRADRVSDAENVLAIDENAKRADSAEQAVDDFNRKVHLRGPVNAVIQKHAADLLEAKTKKQREAVKTAMLEELKSAIRSIGTTT